MSVASSVHPVTLKPVRQWLGKLDLALTLRAEKSALTHVAHLGPLRVQRPFYPEGPECCHLYLLHPPGGLVVGDELAINVTAHEGCRTLITTPSAGKIYAVPGGGEVQQQRVCIHAHKNTFIEWLPQETLVFNGANGKLLTQFYLQDDAQLFAWDIVCLGRPASQLPFVQGQCLQHIEVWHGEQLTFIEKNPFRAGDSAMTARWGLNRCTTSGTLLATLSAERETIDNMLAYLQATWGADAWGLTQKKSLFIARYLGTSALACRKGFEYIWQTLRPNWCKQKAVMPRIWST